ncbi:hypothetical protein KKC_15059, partial [Listeria fleischmannii subsp. coloradonensis]
VFLKNFFFFFFFFFFHKNPRKSDFIPKQRIFFDYDDTLCFLRKNINM